MTQTTAQVGQSVLLGFLADALGSADEAMGQDTCSSDFNSSFSMMESRMTNTTTQEPANIGRAYLYGGGTCMHREKWYTHYVTHKFAILPKSEAEGGLPKRVYHIIDYVTKL